MERLTVYDRLAGVMRYCSYSNSCSNGKHVGEITVIKPCYFNENSCGMSEWEMGCREAEKAYFKLLDWGRTPQEARSVLPNSLKTEVVMTANLREWRHFLRLRTSPAAHPQMREVACMLLDQLRNLVPIVFVEIGGN